MSSSKLRKISKIIKEISVVKSQKNYDISGLTISLCKFYYREPQKQFKDLPIGDYTIETSHNTQTLVINNGTILDKAESIQVCYELDLTSSKYESDFEIDINRLTSSYNEAVDDLHNLWGYIRNIGMVVDDTTIDLILPQLDTNEVWVKTEDGYKGVPLDDVEQSVKEIIEKYSKEKIQEINIETEKHVNNVLKPMLDEYEENIEVQLDMYTNDKKLELDTHEQLKEQELNDLKEQLAKELDDLVKGAVADKGVMPNGTDWHTLTRGSYYVLDLFNSQFKNHPYQLASSDEERGIVIVTETEQGMSKVITYHSTSKRMFFTILVKSGIWSEWSVLGGGKGTVYEITQPNHGFNFNAISLGENNLWELTDPNVGADAIAIKIDNDRFQLLISGQGIVPTSSRDDLGNPFIEDEYYFMSIDVPGGLRKEKPKQIIFQPLFHTRTVEGKLVADVQIGEVHDLTQHIVDSETIKEYGIATEKDLLKKLDKVNTIEELKSQNLKVDDIIEVLGYYTIRDGANHKRVIANEDDGSGVQLANGLWANIVHNGEVNVSWFGCTSETINQTDIINKALEYCKGIIVLIIDKNLYIEEVPENGSIWVKYDGQIIKGINYPKITTNTKSSNPMKVAKKREHIIAEEPIKNITIQGLNFIGFGGYEHYGMFKGRGLTIVNSENCIIQDCKFSNWSMMGLDLISNSNGAIVTKNYFEFNGGYQCVAFNQAGNNSIFSNNIITSKYTGIDKSGSSLVQSTGNILISNNSFYIPQVHAGAGLVIGESQSTDVACVVGNTFNGGYVGINVLANACTNIGNNTIKNCEYGIRITDINDTVKVNHVKISDNMIINCNYGIMDINTKGIYEMLNNSIIKYNTEEIFGKNIWNQKSGFLGICLNDENGHIIVGNRCKNIANPYTININSDIIFRDNIGKTKISFVSVKKFGQRIAYSDLDYVRKNKEIIYTSSLYPTIKGTIVGNKICKEMYILNLTDPQLVSENVYAYETGIDLTNFYKKIFIQLLDSDGNEVLTNDFLGFNGTRIKLKNKNNYTKLMISHYVDYNLIKSDLVKLNSIYHLEKMKQENVYNDYISYMDEKTAYNKQQQKLEQDRQLAYEEALKENPNLSYEEFISVQPMTLNLVEEPQPSEALKRFMEKYL